MWRGFNLDRQMVLGSMGVGVEAVRRAAGEHRARTATDLAPPRHALSGDRKSRAPRDGHSTIPGSLLPGGWPQKVVYGLPIYILTGDSTLPLFRHIVFPISSAERTVFNETIVNFACAPVSCRCQCTASATRPLTNKGFGTFSCAVKNCTVVPTGTR